MKTTSSFALLCGLLLCAATSFGQFKFVSIDVPNATATWAMGIGPGGQIVGGYMDADGNEHGYLYRAGTFTTIDVPGSLAGLPDDPVTRKPVILEGEVNGINPGGDMVGDYFAPPGAAGAPTCVVAFSPPCQRGFLYRHGQFSNVLSPDHAGSIPSSITPDGSIYGCVHDQNLTTTMFGFVRTHAGDFKTLQAGGGEVASGTESHPRSMNNGATPDSSFIVGLYVPPGAARAHGYTVQNGVFTDYLFPGSTATQNWGINPDGNFVGTYRDTSGLFHGFLQPSDGSAPISINFIDPATGIEAVQTRTLSINPGGAIVGFYIDGDRNEHGFMAAPSTD